MRNLFTLAALVALVLAIGSVQAQTVGSYDTMELSGQPAPEIALKTLAGKEVKLSDQKGKVVMVDMWATWCPPCRASLPHVQEVATNKALAEKGLVVWAVNQRENPAKVKAFLAKNKYDFTVLMDAHGQAARAYGVRGIPTTVIIGRDGKVANVFIGFGQGSAQAIDAALEKALAAK